MGLLDSLFNSDSYGGQGGGLLDFLRMSQMQQDQYKPSNGFAPPQPEQAQPLPIGDYRMPRIGAADLYQPQQAMLPPNAQPTQGQLPQVAPQQEQPMQLPPALGGGQMGGNLGAAFQNFTNAGSAMQAIGGGLTGLFTGQRTDPQGMAQQDRAVQFQDLYKVLRSQGENEQTAKSKAMIAVMNPHLAEKILPEVFTNKVDWGVVGEDPISGAKQYGWIDKINHTINGGKSDAGASAGAQTYLNKGVTAYDSSLPGQEYLGQFAPDVQSAILAYKDGRSMPHGNARKGWAENVKKWAQAYGDKINEPVNDQMFFEKKKVRTDLASSGNSSLGGILANGESAFKHLAEYTESSADQGNASHNYPLGGMVAYGQNYLGNTMGGSDTKAKVKAINDNLGHYGQESTKFYAGTGGGVEERMHALKELNATTTSGEEAAAYAAKEKSLMLDRLNVKFDHMRQALGEEEANKEIAKHMPEIQKNIAKIDANIAKLRGEATPQSGSKPQTVIQNGHTYRLQPDGSYK